MADERRGALAARLPFDHLRDELAARFAAVDVELARLLDEAVETHRAADAARDGARRRAARRRAGEGPLGTAGRLGVEFEARLAEDDTARGRFVGGGGTFAAV